MIANTIASETLTVETNGKGNLREVLEADPEILQLTGRATMQVSGEDELGEASDLLKELKLKKQLILDCHKREKAPYLKAGRDVDRKYKIPKSELTKATKLLEQGMDAYLQGLERGFTKKQVQEEVRIREETEKAKKLREETGADIPLPTPRIIQKVPKRVQTGVSSTTFVPKKKWRIPEVDPGKEGTVRRDDPRVGNLDDRFFVLDKEAVERAKKAGEHIPNIEEFVERGTMTT